MMLQNFLFIVEATRTYA